MRATGEQSMRMAWLDCLRGVAAIVVVLFHLRSHIGLHDLGFGYLSVDLFFVLSGIVLGMRYTTSIANGMPLHEFAWHRLRRLYPMVLIATALIATSNALSLPVGQYLEASPQGIWNVLFVTPSLKYPDFFPCDIPMWSLWAELASNVLWFVALRLGRRLTAAAFVVSMLAFAVLAIHRGNFHVGGGGGARDLLQGLLRAFSWFGVGYGIALSKPRRIAHPAVLAVALVLSCALFETHLLPETVSGAILVLTGAALMISLMDLQPKSDFTRKLCAGLGMMSFPLYLIHVPAGQFAFYPIRLGMNPIAAILLTIAVAAFLATLLNEAIVRGLPSRLVSFTPRTA